MTAARAALTAHIGETAFQSDVIAKGRRFGWLAFHHPDSTRDSEAGLPDLILLHEATGRIVYAELKSATGRLRDSQRRFLEAAMRDGRHELALWRPSDMDEISLILAGKKRCGPLVLPPAPKRRPQTGPDALERIVKQAHNTRPRRRASR